MKENFAKTIIITFLITISTISYGQDDYDKIFNDSIKEVSLDFLISFFPSSRHELVKIRANSSKIKSAHFFYKGRKKPILLHKKKVKISKSNFSGALKNYFDSKKTQFKVPLNKLEIETLKSLLMDSTSNHFNIDIDKIESNLHQDCVQLDMSLIKFDTTNIQHRPLILDGAPFRFQLMIINKNKDTLSYTYSGNISEFYPYSELSDYVSFSILYSDLKLHNYLPANSYFSKSTFLQVVLKNVDLGKPKK